MLYNAAEHTLGVLGRRGLRPGLKGRPDTEKSIRVIERVLKEAQLQDAMSQQLPAQTILFGDSSLPFHERVNDLSSYQSKMANSITPLWQTIMTLMSYERSGTPYLSSSTELEQRLELLRKTHPLESPASL
jgi:hypothetical protein